MNIKHTKVLFTVLEKALSLWLDDRKYMEKGYNKDPLNSISIRGLIWMTIFILYSKGFLST